MIMKAYCPLCDLEFEKPQWEHLINQIYRLGGNALTNKCPYCMLEILEFNLGVDVVRADGVMEWQGKEEKGTESIMNG